MGCFCRVLGRPRVIRLLEILEKSLHSTYIALAFGTLVCTQLLTVARTIFEPSHHCIQYSLYIVYFVLFGHTLAKILLVPITIGIHNVVVPEA